MKSYFMKWCLPLMMLSLLVGCQQEETEFTTQPEEVLQTRAAFEVPLQYPEVPDDAIDVTTVSVLEPGQAYVILGNYSGNLPHYGNTGEKIVVYVLGNWDVQNWNLETGVDIVVTGGGTLTSSANSSLVINGNSDIYVLEGGNANFSNDFLYFSNGGSLYVYGNMTATFLQVNSGNFYVGPTGYASVGTLISQGSGTILNEGTLIVAEDGWDEGETDMPVYEYNVTYVPGVNLYVLEDTNPFEIAFRVTDNQGFGATVNTEDFNSVRFTLPEGTYFYPEDLPYTLVFDPEPDGTVFATIRVTLN